MKFPKTWEEFASALTVFTIAGALLFGSFQTYNKVDSTNALVLNTQELVKVNTKTLSDRIVVIKDMKYTIQELKMAIEDLRSHYFEIVYVDYVKGEMLLKLPQEHGGRTIKLTFETYP